MFNLLGLDWGSKFIGIALGNLKTGLVIPHSFAEAKSFFVAIDKILAAYPINKIVLGRPVNFQLKPTEVTEKVELFASKLHLKYPQIELVLFNERNSSKDNLPKLELQGNSKSLKTSKKLLATNSIHALAAKTILEYYLEGQSKSFE